MSRTPPRRTTDRRARNLGCSRSTGCRLSWSKDVGLGAGENWSAWAVMKREEMRMRAVMAIRMIDISIILELIWKQ